MQAVGNAAVSHVRPMTCVTTLSKWLRPVFVFQRAIDTAVIESAQEEVPSPQVEHTQMTVKVRASTSEPYTQNGKAQ